MKCEDCKHFHEENKRIKYPNRWMCSIFPRDEINFVSNGLRLTDPFYYCATINGLGQCRFFEKGKENE